MVTKPGNEQCRVTSIPISLPRKFSVRAHVKNIDYCIEQLKNYPFVEKNPVVGYLLITGWGNREDYHRILPEEKARELARENYRFRFITLEDLLKKKEDIEKGRYIIDNGLIINFNPAYSH